MTIAVERRGCPRHATVTNRAIVQFMGRGKVRILGASLVNISASGALLRMHEPPRLNEAVSIRVEYPVRTAWMIAISVRVTDDGEVGIAFAHGCNRGFFWTVTRGEDFRSTEPDGSMPANPDDEV